MTAVPTRIALLLALAMLLIPAASSARDGAEGKGAQVVRACAHKKTGLVRIVRSARACRVRRERKVSWNVVGRRGQQGPTGARGAQGATGPAGAPGLPGATGPPSVTILTARLTGFVGLISPSFGSPAGTSAVSSTESSVQTLSPARSISAANLAVQTTAAPGSGNSVTVTLRANGANTALACTISGAATTCSDTADAPTLAAGSALSLGVSSTVTAPSMSLLVGLETH